MANIHTHTHTLSDWQQRLVDGVGRGDKRLGFKAISALTMAARWRDLYDGACGDFITRCMRATLGGVCLFPPLGTAFMAMARKNGSLV